jgi:hypothetical protein
MRRHNTTRGGVFCLVLLELHTEDKTHGEFIIKAL